MLVLLLVLAPSCLFSIVHSNAIEKRKGHDEEFTCSSAFKLLRCQKEDFSRKLLINFRHQFNWNHSPETVHRIACLCNEMAEKEGFPYFGLSFYGLCNGFHNITDNRTSEAGTKCVDGGMDICDLNVDKECDGGPLSEALYKTGSRKDEKFVDHPKNGNFQLIVPDNSSLTCPSGYRFRKLACQKEDFARKELFNDRHTIDWKNFKVWLKGMVCKCRAYAKANKFEYFSVSFWGLCGGLDKHGHKHTTTSDHCKRTVKGTATENTCDLDDLDEPCAGVAWSDVVYDTETHPCDVNNGGCAGKCHRNEESYYCSCGIGFKLQKDRHSCQKQ